MVASAMEEIMRKITDKTKLKDELQDEKLSAVSGGTLSNLTNKRDEMLKTVANNLKA
jgi:hypothetical protein